MHITFKFLSSHIYLLPSLYKEEIWKTLSLVSTWQEKVKDRQAWRAAVHGVRESDTPERPNNSILNEEEEQSLPKSWVRDVWAAGQCRKVLETAVGQVGGNKKRGQDSDKHRGCTPGFLLGRSQTNEITSPLTAPCTRARRRTLTANPLSRAAPLGLCVAPEPLYGWGPSQSSEGFIQSGVRRRTPTAPGLSRGLLSARRSCLH